jgi:hypothetical protein
MNIDDTVWEELRELQQTLVSDYALEKGITVEEAFRALYVGEWITPESIETPVLDFIQDLSLKRITRYIGETDKGFKERIRGITITGGNYE